VSRGETSKRVVALTFDDGPTAEVLDTIIEVLAERGVQATFFVTGSCLDRRPDWGKRLVEAGHELGNHAYSHRRLLCKRVGFIRDEIERSDALIRAAGHRGEIYFRPPYGQKLLALPYYLRRTLRTTVMWDVAPDLDPPEAPTSEGIVGHVLERVRPGSIILLHVWFPSQATSLAAVPPLIDGLHGRGYRITTVGELLRGRSEE
jgi:peptidoglycan/xylan/chitin deacetylase (PgdA/CDA1 family)